jgi:hypothetical protein
MVDLSLSLFYFWTIGFIDTLNIQLWTTGNYRATADLHTLPFTITHALGFSVFTSRILATDITVTLSFQITHEVFFARSNSFLAIANSEDSTQFNSSVSKLIPAGWRLEIRLTLLNRTLLYYHFARTTQKTQPLLLGRCIYSAVA